MNFNELSAAAVCYHPTSKELTLLLKSLRLAVNNQTNFCCYIINNNEIGNLWSEYEIEYSAKNQKFSRLSDVNSSITDENLGLLIELETWKKFDMDLHVIEGHGNLGYGRAHNLALELTEKRFHLMLNTDVEIGIHALEAGIKALELNPASVLAAPYATNAQNVKINLCKRYPDILTLALRGFGTKSIKKIFDTRLGRYEYRGIDDLTSRQDTAKITMASGCFMLCLTSVLKSCNGFDHRYFLYFEDFDLSMRIAKYGDLIYVPQMKIVHTGGNAAKKSWRHIIRFVISSFYFFNKHGWRFVRRD